MQINILAIGKRLTAWQETGIKTFTDRFPKHWHFTMKALPLSQRSTHSVIKKVIQQEGEQLLKHIPASHHVIALDEHGSLWSTQQLSEQLATWQDEQQQISFLIGGPDGLAPACKTRANALWSLSPLTLPHGLVRILLVEQLYRAYTLLIGHPYHRESVS